MHTYKYAAKYYIRLNIGNNNKISKSYKHTYFNGLPKNIHSFKGYFNRHCSIGSFTITELNFQEITDEEERAHTFVENANSINKQTKNYNIKQNKPANQPSAAVAPCMDPLGGRR